MNTALRNKSIKKPKPKMITAEILREVNKHQAQHQLQSQDEEIEKMLKNWDKVICFYCGKEISMLNARMILNGQHFACKSH